MMQATPCIPPPYEPRYFVDREHALDLVLGKVRALLQGEPVRNRTTTFLGPRGSGKSWLLREIYRLLQEEQEFKNSTCSLFIGLGSADAGIPHSGIHIPSDELAEEWPLLAVSQLLESVGKNLGISAPQSTSLDQWGSCIIQACRSLDRPVVVIVDGVDEMPPDFLRELETHCLAPLALESYVLIVLGGRVRDPRRYTWIMPELKLYTDEVWLEPFAESDTAEQLKRLSSAYPVSPNAASEVVRAGNGYPLSNFTLARYLAGDPPQWTDKPTALEECAKILLENVDESLREYFWALCVLRGFDEFRMALLLALWFGGPVEAWTYSCCRRIREDMAATRLVRWRGPQGYVMDEAVRTVLENALREKQPERWRALHRSAYELYSRWVEQYPTAKERWEPEAQYHQQKL